MCHPISEFNEELEVFRRRGTTIRAEQLRMPIFVDKIKIDEPELSTGTFQENVRAVGKYIEESWSVLQMQMEGLQALRDEQTGGLNV